MAVIIFLVHCASKFVIYVSVRFRWKSKLAARISCSIVCNRNTSTDTPLCSKSITKNLQVQYPQIISSSHTSIVNDKSLQGQFPQINHYQSQLHDKNLQGQYQKITSASHSFMANDKNLQGQYSQIISSSLSSIFHF